MNTWLVLAISEDDRLYAGHSGYEDDVSTLYRFDSFVPNAKRVATGDTFVIRDKETVLGTAVVAELSTSLGEKEHKRCPACGLTKIKTRKSKTPLYRCECGTEFDSPVIEMSDCTLFEARFAETFSPVRSEVSIQQLWSVARNLNKQHSIMELDSGGVTDLLGGRFHHAVPHSLDGGLGAEYEEADEDVSVKPGDVHQEDPALLERGLRAHRRTQNLLANYVRSHGHEPRRPSGGEPNYDLAWKTNEVTVVCEVKSLTEQNQEKQLRLGLGQVLRFAHQLNGLASVSVLPVLAVEVEPTDPSWSAVCESHGVQLIWPETFDRVLKDLVERLPERETDP